ncbi:VWA domain-containing protein [Sulfurimonas sp. MAG313]|nr:VWA domain-containing protein [Sulfurimonas sp. MAG313]MDF1881137.1 VWA domain-containing protein [Sulfurimonas sp. MAG313]
MSFLSPDFFWLLVVFLLMLLYRKKNKKHDIAPSTRVKLVFLYLSLGLMMVSLARPVFEMKPVKQNYQGSEVVIALDLSYSMQANDIKPTRLLAAKMFIKKLIKERIHERFALLGFTTNAIILSPLTSDAELLGHQLELIDTNLVITKGTDMSSVLELSTKLSQIKEKNLIIIGDGGDSSDFSKEIAYAKEKGISISIVMMATRIGSRLKDKNGQWLKDKNKHLVVSSSNVKAKSLSDATGGVFVNFDGVSKLSAWLDTREKKLSSADVLMHEELFYYPLFLALVFFIVGVSNVSKYLSKWMLIFLALVSSNIQADMRSFSTQSAGDKAYAEQKYLDELEIFKKIGMRSPEDFYNLGNAYYKVGQYEEAIDTYKGVSSTSATLKAKVFHNLGNAYVRIEMYEEARVAYEKSLILFYNKETDENLLHISKAKKAEGLQTGQQKGKKKNDAKKVNSKAEQKDTQKKKGAGSSNMKASAKSGAGTKKKGKKNKSEAQVQFNNKQTGLSYKQYELINERKTNEEHPW